MPPLLPGEARSAAWLPCQGSCRRRRLSGSPPRLCAELTPTVILTVKPVFLRKLERAQVAVLLFEIRGQVPDAEFGFKLLPDLIDAGSILVGADGKRSGEPIKAVLPCCLLYTSDAADEP